MGVNQKEKMIRMMGIDVRDPLTHVKGTKNRRIVACTAIKKITFVLIALKLWRSEIAKRYWPKSNCFNCTSNNHRADSCRRGGCHNCQRKRHTSICDRSRPNSGRFMTAQNKGLEQVTCAAHFQILERAVHILRLLSWIILEFNVLRWCLGPLARSLESMAWPLAV